MGNWMQSEGVTNCGYVEKEGAMWDNPVFYKEETPEVEKSRKLSVSLMDAK